MKIGRVATLFVSNTKALKNILVFFFSLKGPHSRKAICSTNMKMMNGDVKTSLGAKTAI